MTTIEVRPMEGGEEAQRFARELADACAAYLARQNAEATLSADGSRGFTLDTDAPPGVVSWMAGTHKVQRSSGGARHTSAANLLVLKDQRRSQPT